MTIAIVDPTVYANDVGKPTDGQKLVTDLGNVFSEVNTIENSAVTFAGNKIFSGVVTISTTPVNPTDASSKAYVDSRFIGTLSLWGSNVLPVNGLWANGQAVSRTTYAALFAVLGTTWGVGDGSTTFNVPNLCEVVPVGTSAMGGVAPRGLLGTALTIGSVVGSEKHVLTQAELPAIHPTINWFGLSNLVGGGVSGANVALTGSSFGQVSTGNISVDLLGSGAGHTSMQPTTGFNWVIWYA